MSVATILIVSSRPTNREHLVTPLGYKGHRLLHAADGAEALAITRAERPNLIIADILMSTMDGYEFVRQLRDDPAIAATPVIFYTPHYPEREARALAEACAVSHILTRPAEPEVVIRTVDAALGMGDSQDVFTTAEALDTDDLRLLADKMTQNASELSRANARLGALVDLSLELGLERNPRHLLEAFCHAAREIIGAKYALVGALDADGAQLRFFSTSGMDKETCARLGSVDPHRGGIGRIVHESRCLRLHNPGGDPAAIDLPASFPTLYSWLGAPIVSPGQVHGWVGLLNKIGAEVFSDEDERLAGILAAQVGRIYENGSLYADLLLQTAKLAEEVSERQLGEEALRVSEELFRGAFEHTGVAMVLTDANNRFIRVNDAFARMFGYSPTQLLEMAMADVTEHDDLAESYARREVLLAGDSHFFQMEKRYIHKEGHTFWGLTNVSLVRDASGRPSVYLGQVQDITEQKRAEAELRQSHALLNAVVEGTSDAVFVKDREGKYLLFNGAASRSVGKPVSEVIGRDDTALFDPESSQLVMDRDQRVMSAGREETEEEVLTAAGTTRVYLATKAPYRNNQGEIVGIIGISRDITERKHLEDQFRLAVERLRHVVVSSPSVLFTLPVAAEQKLGINWTSDNLPQLFGYSAEAALGQDWWLGNVHPEDRDRVVAQFQSDLIDQERSTYEYRFRHADGNYRWTQCEARVIRDVAGRPTEVVGSWSDITERRYLEDQFRQAQKMEAVGRLAGGVAHDFNNLLTVINGYGELVLGGMTPEDPNRSFIHEMVAAGDRAAALTRQLLAFSRKSILEPRILDLKALLADVDKMLRRVIGEDIQLTAVVDSELGAIKADPGQVEQVIFNLVINARDAMPRGGCLTIEMQNVELEENYAQSHLDARPGAHILLAVSDTGCGMDQATMSRIFEPFFSTKGEQGTGLGLATVHGIVKQSGGHVAVYSELGRGTTFKVYLPRVERRLGQVRSHSEPAAMPRGSETILLVEDADGVRALSRHVLQGCGYTVLEARDGVEALLIASQYDGRIDLLLTDVDMPRMSGRDVAEHLKAKHAGMKILFLSGYTDDAVVRHGILEAEVAFLQKPFSPASLSAKVREVLEQAD